MTEDREPRPDDCPYCGGSMWMGLNNPEGCQCKLPNEVFHMAKFYGSPVEVVMPGQCRHTSSRRSGHEADVRAKLTKRVELFHFIGGLRNHLKWAEEHMRNFDQQMEDATCKRCGFVECSCLKSLR